MKKQESMGYSTRAFCKSEVNPTIRDIMEFISQFEEITYTNLSEEELESTHWNHFELFYNEEELPILVEMNKVEDSRGLAKQEIEKFKKLIGKPKFLETAKKKVIRHLNESKYVIRTQLQSSDIDEIGEDVCSSVIWLFKEKFEGIIQDDHVGIYTSEKRAIFLD